MKCEQTKKFSNRSIIHRFKFLHNTSRYINTYIYILIPGIFLQYNIYVCVCLTTLSISSITWLFYFLLYISVDSTTQFFFLCLSLPRFSSSLSFSEHFSVCTCTGSNLWFFVPTPRSFLTLLTVLQFLICHRRTSRQEMIATSNGIYLLSV